MAKLKLQDAELKTGTDELWGAIQKALKKPVAIKEESEDDDMKDESYETVSEEDISGDEGEDTRMKE